MTAYASEDDDRVTGGEEVIENWPAEIACGAGKGDFECRCHCDSY